MNILTAEKCREQFEKWWESEWCGEAPMDGWEFVRGDDGYIDEGINSQWDAWHASRKALEKALPVLEQKTHESVIAAELESVRDSLTLNPHQNSIISCAIDRLNELNVRVVELSRSLFEHQEPQPSTNPQIDNDGGVKC